MSDTPAQMSSSALCLFQTSWEYLGQIPPRKNRALYYVYSFLLTVFITIWHPLHLAIGLFLTANRSDFFKLLLIALTCISCSIKTFIMWWNFSRINQVNQLFMELDKRIVLPAEVRYYKHSVVNFARKFWFFIGYLCIGVALSSEIATIARGLLGEWRLSFPAYFPFDVYSSPLNQVAAHLYQILSGGVLLAQNLCNDTYGTVVLMLLGGHVYTLRMRILNLGATAQKTDMEHYEELKDCIQDHRRLLELCEIIESVISWIMYLQLVLAAVSICITILYIIFYVHDTLTFIYYLTHLFSMSIEIFPCCYYATNMELEFEKLTYSIFSCNWMDQNKIFKQNVRIFAEQSLKKKTLLAGGMLPINLNTFFSTWKGAYSLYAVVSQMK